MFPKFQSFDRLLTHSALFSFAKNVDKDQVIGAHTLPPHVIDKIKISAGGNVRNVYHNSNNCTHRSPQSVINRN